MLQNQIGVNTLKKEYLSLVMHQQKTQKIEH